MRAVIITVPGGPEVLEIREVDPRARPLLIRLRGFLAASNEASLLVNHWKRRSYSRETRVRIEEYSISVVLRSTHSKGKGFAFVARKRRI
jgi:hypothetical protein